MSSTNPKPADRLAAAFHVEDSTHTSTPACSPASDRVSPARLTVTSALADGLASALAIALLGSCLLALAECALASLLVNRRLAGEPFPAMLAVAAAGKTLVSHLIVWTPLLALVGVARSLLTRRRPSPGEPFLAGVMVALAGCAVIPADLGLAGYEHASWIGIGCGIALAAGWVVHRLLRRMLQRAGVRAVRRRTNAGLALAAVFACVTGVVFIRSPLFNADRYRVQPHAPAPAAPDGALADSGNLNVLWIILDTVRADRTGVCGDAPTTPFLKKLGEKSAVFTHAVSNGTWTVPSHASMFTGLSIREHDATYHSLWLDDGKTTIAEALRDRGYDTALFTNNPLLSPETNLDQGFDRRRVLYHYRHLFRFSLEYLCERWGVSPPVSWFDGDFGAALTNQFAASWLDEVTRTSTSRPFLLVLNYMDAHLPYRVPSRYRRAFMSEQQVARSYALRRAAHGDLFDALDLRANVDGADFLDEADRDVIRRQYDAAIRYLDGRVAEMIELIERRGLLERTLVVITSDHGECFGVHGTWAHRFETYNDLTRVVMLLREPQQVPARITAPVQLSDLYGTILNSVMSFRDSAHESMDRPRAATSAPSRDAFDLLALADHPPPERFVISEYEGADPLILPRIQKRGDTALFRRALPQTAVCDGVFKLIESTDKRRELYDEAADPAEIRDLLAISAARNAVRQPSPKAAAAAERLAAYLRDWHKRTPAYKSSRGGGAAGAGDALRDALKSLGYVGGDE